MVKSNIGKTYKSSQNIYDDVLTQSNWLTKMYLRLFWVINDLYISDKVLNYLPKNFNGKLLNVPVGTAIFTYKNRKTINGFYC